MYTPNLSFIDQWMWTLCPTDKGQCPMVVAALSLSMQHKSLMGIWADYLLPTWESGLLHDVISAALQGIDEDSRRGLTHCFEALCSYCFALCHTLFQIIKKSRNFSHWSNLYYKIALIAMKWDQPRLPLELQGHRGNGEEEFMHILVL